MAPPRKNIATLEVPASEAVKIAPKSMEEVELVVFNRPISLGAGFTSSTIDLSQPRHKALVSAMEYDPSTGVITLTTTPQCGWSKGRRVRLSQSFWSFFI